MIHLSPSSPRFGTLLRSTRCAWIFSAFGAVAVACSSAPSEDIGTSSAALSCGGSVGDWTDFPYGPPNQQCVAGVYEFYKAKFGVVLNGSVGPCGAPYGNDGACNYWVTEGSEPSVRNPGAWERFAWGTETPKTYDMVIFKAYTGEYGTAFGHVASVDHVDGNGTLWVVDSNYNGTGHGACPHPISWAPYGFYRLKALAVPPAGGTLDSVTCQAIAGTAQDPSAGGASINVEVYLDGPKGSGASLGTVATGAGQAFSMPTPVSLYDGHAHSIYAYAEPVTSGAGEGQLANAPATLHCAAALTGDFHGTGHDDVIEFRDDWSSLPSCGQWGSVWSCSDDAASYIGGAAAGNAGSGIFSGATPLVGDMNGDGRTDVIEYDAAGATLPVCLSTENGWACENLAATYLGGAGAGNSGSGVFSGSTAFAADVNGDGKADIVQFDSAASTVPVCFATEDGWGCRNLAATYVSGIGAGNGGSGIFSDSAASKTIPLVGDVNGDGKADLVQWNPSWSSIPACLATSEGWACTNASATYLGGGSVGNSGSGVFPHAWPRLADVNGDGKADLIEFDPTASTIPVCLSTENGWACESLDAVLVGGGASGNAGSGVFSATSIVIADLNGDGRADVLQYVAGSSTLPVCFSTERGWSCENLPLTGGAALPYGLPLVGTFAGDKAMALAQMTPEADTDLLQTCNLGGRGWSCSSDTATLK